MPLCQNRPEGFGPGSILSSPLPTQCFFDTILVPLPAWVQLAVLAISICLGFIFRRSGTPSTSSTSTNSNSNNRGTRAAARAGADYAGDEPGSTIRTRRRPGWLRRALEIAYYFAVGVVLLMESIEVARLALAHLGVGLVPFVHAGCAVAVVLQVWNSRSSSSSSSSSSSPLGPWWRLANLALWLGGLAITSAKLAALRPFLEGGGGSSDGAGAGASPAPAPLARSDSAYPVPDQITDLAVLVPFYVLLAAAEIGLMLVPTGGRGQGFARPRGEHIELKD